MVPTPLSHEFYVAALRKIAFALDNLAVEARTLNKRLLAMAEGYDHHENDVITSPPPHPRLPIPAHSSSLVTGRVVVVGSNTGDPPRSRLVGLGPPVFADSEMASLYAAAHGIVRGERFDGTT